MTELTTEALITEALTDVNNSTGMIDTVLNSNVFLLEPWFMSIAIAVLMVLIVVTFLYTMLFRRNKNRESQEAILNLDENQTIINEPKYSNKQPRIIVVICLLLVALLIGINVVVYEIRGNEETFHEFYTRICNIVYSFIKQPWFIGIVFGVLLLLAVVLSIRSIIQENKVSSRQPKNRRVSRKEKRLGSQPWFIAFIFAVVLIVILTMALFYLLFQQHGETFKESVSRFFILEPWFFGIVVGVLLLTLIIFNIYRILRGNGENYSVDGDITGDKVIPIESQGFDEYPSKGTVNQSLVSPSSVEQKPFVMPISTETKSPVNEVSAQGPVTLINMPNQNKNVIQPSLSLQLNEGNFYDEKQFHDEDDSMAEYGLGENDQFNDEGSFIGLYNRDRIQNYMAQFNKNNLNN